MILIEFTYGNLVLLGIGESCCKYDYFNYMNDAGGMAWNDPEIRTE